MKHPISSEIFDPNCRKCGRLSQFLDEVKVSYPEYHARPVPPFGDNDPGLLIVGLAPGMHGANATGRPFTGDYAGILLYETLYKFGFSSSPHSTSVKDGLALKNCRITNAVKCLPPQNKPTTQEIKVCNPFLKREIAGLKQDSVLIALGLVAHNAILKALDKKPGQYKFAHGAVHKLEQHTLIDSYHCSRYNTQTRRLTEEMFHAVFKKARKIIELK